MRIGSNRRRQGQGMTEYIVIVGLIAILLIAAITRYKEQVRVTIEGSANATENIADDMGKASSSSDNESGIPGLPNDASPIGPSANGTGTVYKTPSGDRYTVNNGTATPGGRLIGE
jgi:Flp pilus assembly pilin Flp